MIIRTQNVYKTFMSDFYNKKINKRDKRGGGGGGGRGGGGGGGGRGRVGRGVGSGEKKECHAESTKIHTCSFLCCYTSSEC